VKRSWELVADKLSKAGWSLGWVSALDSEGRTIWIVDAHRDNGKRFVVRSDKRLILGVTVLLGGVGALKNKRASERSR
jgi:hypothetical protein